MADVREVFLLCRTFRKGSLLGIERHCDKNHVILTFKDKGVLVYNLENNKLVYSLPVQQRKEFTSAVVQEPISRSYIGIVDNLNICQWSEKAEDLEDCQQIKVEQPVFKILVSSSCSVGPVIVYQDGTCSLLSNCSNIKQTRKTRRKSTAITHRILTCSLVQHNDVSIVCIAKYKDHRLVLSISRFLIGKDKQNTREWIIDTPSEDEELVNCCFQCDGSVNLLTCWSRGSLCVTELKDILESLSNLESQEQMNLTSRCINRMDMEMSKNTKITHKKPVVMATMDSTHVCLNHERETKNGLEDAVHIYETKFGTKQACITLDKPSTDKDDRSLMEGCSGIDCILCTDGYICMGVDQTVAACSYRVKESSLATALGKMAQNKSMLAETTPIRPLLCIPQLPEPNKDLNEWIDMMKTKQATEETVLQKLTNPIKTKSMKEFTLELNQYLDSKLFLEEKDDPVDAVKKSPLKAKDKKFKGRYLLSQHFVLTVLSRCLEETKFWPKEALSCLIQTRCLPGSSSPDLLKKLTEKREMDMILKCLKDIQGIPESSLVFCIQYVLEASDSIFGDKSHKEDNISGAEDITKTDGCQFGEKRSNLLCHLLSYPVNDVFIQDSIKKLNSSQVMLLTEFLVHIVKSAPRTSFTRKDSPLDYPTVIDWMGWIINSHYTTLVLNSNIHGLLLDLYNSVQDQVKLFEELGQLEGFLVQYKNKQPLPTKENVGLYTVEMLEL